MKTSNPQLALVSSLLCAALALISLNSCRMQTVREVLRMDITRNLTHIRAGQTAHLSAYQEYREAEGSFWGVSAAPLNDIPRREAIAARWSVSDVRLASVSEDGALTALQPGRVTITSAWENYTAAMTVEVLKELPVASLPQLSSKDAAGKCAAETVDLSFDDARTLRFRLGFQACDDFQLEARAPETSLPWRFETNAGVLEIKSARGPVVKGSLRRLDASEVSFTAWSEGAGAYPVELRGRTVLLVGDSMAGGLAPFLKKKVEAAGGRLLSEQEQSSTIIWWQGSGKLRALVASHRPDIVFIALGSNELFTSKPEARAPLIRRMVEDVGARPAYWIGPPTWKPGGRLDAVIAENFQAGRFYSSDQLAVPRATDGKHPTLAGFERWVELVWYWYARSL